MTDLNLDIPPSRSRTALLVAALHAAVLLMVCLPGLFHKPAPEFLRVQLASPRSPMPTNPAPQPQPTANAAESAPESTDLPPPDPPQKNNWRARSSDDIRRNAKLDPVRTTNQSSQPAAQNEHPPDLSTLRSALQRETKVSVAAEAESAPQTSWDAGPYAAAVQTHLYERWQKPAGGSPDDSARARLRIDRNGRVLEARLLDADTPAMRQSVRQLLDSLTALPAPAEFRLSDSSVTLPIVFRLKQ